MKIMQRRSREGRLYADSTIAVTGWRAQYHPEYFVNSSIRHGRQIHDFSCPRAARVAWLASMWGGLEYLYKYDQHPFQGGYLGAEHEASTPLGTLVSFEVRFTMQLFSFSFALGLFPHLCQDLSTLHISRRVIHEPTSVIVHCAIIEIRR